MMAAPRLAAVSGYIGAPGASTGVVVPFRRADRRTEAADLRMSLVAAGEEMRAASRWLTNSLADPDPLRIVAHVAGRLSALGESYIAEGEGREPEPAA